MRVKLRVFPRAKKAQIKNCQEILKVYLHSPAVEGRANKELIGALAKYYNTKKYNITIVRGHKSKDKIVEIREVS